MKKHFNSKKRKAYLLKRSRKEIRKRQTRKPKIKLLRSKYIISRASSSKGYSYNKYKKIAPPENFSLVENADEVLGYFKQYKELILRKKKINFDLTNVTNLTPDAIALLIGKIKDKKYSGKVSLMGVPPKDPNLKKMFLESGFYSHVSSEYQPSKNDNLLLKKVTNYKVENGVAKKASEMAVEHTFEKKVKFRPIYEILIECMANTNNHADLANEGKYIWWLFVYREPETKITKFCFFDLGVGIFSSIPVKRHLKLLAKMGINTNVDLLGKLFSGEISSRTGLEERGQGIPLIFNNSQHPQIKNFVMIANDVYANLSTGKNIKLENSFSGTFFHWELHPYPINQN